MNLTRRQRAIEREYGKPLRLVLDELLYARNLTYERAARRLGIDPVTLWHWRKRLDAERPNTDTHSPAPADPNEAARQEVAV